MTRTGNNFDCVAIKNEIQRRMLQEFEGMSDEEQRIRIQQELTTSDSVVARKWRSCRDAAIAIHRTSMA